MKRKGLASTGNGKESNGGGERGGGVGRERRGGEVSGWDRGGSGIREKGRGLCNWLGKGRRNK